MSARFARADDGMLARWARFAVRRRRLVLASWIGGLIALVVVWQTIGAEFASNFTLPGTESQRALDLLEDGFPQQAGDTARIVFKADAGGNDPAARARIDEVLAQAQQLPGVAGVSSPFEQGAGGVSQDGPTPRCNTRSRPTISPSPMSSN
jgi:putative drug exporter of the RND superfamily